MFVFEAEGYVDVTSDLGGPERIGSGVLSTATFFSRAVTPRPTPSRTSDSFELCSLGLWRRAQCVLAPADFSFATTLADLLVPSERRLDRHDILLG